MRHMEIIISECLGVCPQFILNDALVKKNLITQKKMIEEISKQNQIN